MHARRSVRPRRLGQAPGRARGEAGRFSAAEGHVPGCRKDGQTVGSDWLPVEESIEGVKVREVRHLIKGGGGLLTELFRADWGLDGGTVAQVFEVRLSPREVSAWHAHRFTHDRLFVTHGAARFVLYDARTGSPTYGRVNELRFGADRPALLAVPPGVWHGVQNLTDAEARVMNLVDKAYSYEDPDHWRLPPDTRRIPYTFPAASRDR